jgi:hypothetical protein
MNLHNAPEVLKIHIEQRDCNHLDAPMLKEPINETGTQTEEAAVFVPSLSLDMMY